MNGDGVILTPRQQEFVDFQEGCALLHAPVGTGKTRALAERAAKAIRRGVPPDRILCVTFTNRAAAEMRQRVALHCKAEARWVEVRTFHGLCAWMLRREAKEIGLSMDFVIFDEEDSLEVLRDLVSEQDARSLYHYMCSLKVEVDDGQLALGPIPKVLFAKKRDFEPEILAYQDELAANHALDFADLILMTRVMLMKHPHIRARWQGKFGMIQVDEMQDTHLSEYGILRVLAEHCRNLVLAGDFDQTIYEWRGSNPGEILRRFRRDFSGGCTFSFDENHRATRSLVAAAANVVASYSQYAPPKPAVKASPGRPIEVHFARNSEEEADWIARRLKTELDKNPNLKAGVLTRPNHRALTIAEALTRMNIPHLTVETFEFFRRQEVKDAIAYLRFLLNPWDGRSFRRILSRPRRGIGERTIAKIDLAYKTGLRLVDLAQPAAMLGDPFALLLNPFAHGDLIILDVETTGLDPSRHEVIELAGLRLEKGKEAEYFHRYLKNTRSVGDSVSIHGLTDEFLMANGDDPARVLAEFGDFCGDALIVGHNISFDLRMLLANGKRLGVPLDFGENMDTLEIARRFLDLDDYRLEYLKQCLGLPDLPSHSALDDVRTTRALLEHLIPLVKRDSLARRAVVGSVAPQFAPVVEELESLRAKVDLLRPWQLLDIILDRSGLADLYSKEPRRLANLAELKKIFKDRDEIETDPRSSLEALMTFAALARNVDRLDGEDNRVKVLTIHQAKGLEFDLVIIAGLSENEFPVYGAIKEGRELEERRVFYVALTRAKDHLILTGHGSHKGKIRAPSRYFAMIGDGWEERDSSRVTEFQRWLAP